MPSFLRRERAATDRATIALRGLWGLIHRPCEVLRDASRKFYGALGVTICRAWAEFEPFRHWALERGYRTGMSVLRAREASNFTPGNFPVASTAEATARRFERNPSFGRGSSELRVFGVTKTGSEWARDRRCQVHPEPLLHRLRSGMTPEDAITTKVGPGKRRDGPRAQKADPKRDRLDARLRALLEGGTTPFRAARELGGHHWTVVRTVARLGITRTRKPGTR